jgi:D-beta-D-heptose 7-phosphate kinase/D-beta-D-heptose 1-phosphate adenosyltransferase
MEIDSLKFETCKILVVGDLMIDEYLWGSVDRISPEAPVQVVSVEKEEYRPGGSGNVVNNLVALGAEVLAVGVIGTGREGELLLEKFKKIGVDTRGIIQEPERPTTRKTRIIAANQHVLRIDRETKKEISDRTFHAIAEFTEKIMPEVDIVLISDYGKGMVTKSMLSRLVALAKKHKKITIVDPKGLDFKKYSGVSIITPNKKEAALAQGVEIVDEQSIYMTGTKILESVEIDKLLITCGKDGMILFERNKEPYKIGAVARQVFDVSGAGDTVLSVLGLAIASGLSFKEGVELANTAAGIVVGKVGTATVSKKEIIDAMKPAHDAISTKYKLLSELEDLIHKLKKKNKRVVLTNGCFDLLHAGHIMFFSASRQSGDILIVALDDDASVKRLKGEGRPVIRAKERVRIISALDVVDYVVVFSTGQLDKLIEIIKPDILTKGTNYNSKEVYGRKLVEKFGGRVELIPVSENISSTSIINNIKKSKF